MTTRTVTLAGIALLLAFGVSATRADAQGAPPADPRVSPPPPPPPAQPAPPTVAAQPRPVPPSLAEIRAAQPSAAPSPASGPATPPVGATMRCRDGTWLSGAPAADRCTQRGGVLIYVPQRPTPPPPARARP